MGQRTISFTINKNKFRYLFKEYSGVHTLEVETKDKKVFEYAAFTVPELVGKMGGEFSNTAIESVGRVLKGLNFGG